MLADQCSYDLMIAEPLLPDENGTELLRNLYLKALHLAAISFHVISKPYLIYVADFELRCFLKKPFDLNDFEIALTALKFRAENPGVDSSEACLACE